MLLIGDMHMTSAKGERVIWEIRSFVASYPQEREIVFLGDYVYHFSYDRRALLMLYSFFVELCKEGKIVHVIAGNHDRIADHFVFEEAQKTLELVQGAEMPWRLLFYTEPCFQRIDGKDCLMFPFFHPSLQQKIPLSPSVFGELAASRDRQEQYAAYVNELLHTMIQQRKSEHLGEQWYSGNNDNDPLIVIHHRYIAQTAFPGVKWTFSYRSPGLSPHRLDDADIRMISGHIHSSFAHKNYLCVGSSRHTSPLEIDEQKRAMCLPSGEKDVVEVTPLTGFPYVMYALQDSKGISQWDVERHMEEVAYVSQQILQQGVFEIKLKLALQERVWREVTVTLQWESVRYDTLHTSIDERFLQILGEVRIKQIAKSDAHMQELLQVWGEELQRRLSSWKELLQSYLEQKYWAQAQDYMDMLKEMSIL